MAVEPDFAAFKAVYEAGKPQVVRRARVSDLETPVSAYLKLAAGRKDAFLLESVQGGEIWGRYSIIGADPDIVWRVEGDEARMSVQTDGRDGPPTPDGPPLASLRNLIERSRIDLPDGYPPMSAGLFGYLGYDMVRHMERLPAPNPDSLGLADARLTRPTIIAVFDSVRQEIVLTTPIYPQTDISAKDAYDRACARIEAALSRLDAPMTAPAPSKHRDADKIASNTTPERYMDMVRAAKSYIRQGDIFQVVASQRFRADFSLPPFALYRALRRSNPSPFLFFLDFPDAAIVGSSPEVLVRVRGREITVRPIAGTRPRGATPEEDAALERDLLADPKERAEHLMLLDLGRSDASRVSKIGSVRPTEQYIVERYSHVMHIVSNVCGELRNDADALDALVAGFPAGTVSGAPKIRAMEIIDELEAEKRGVYAGAVGYFAANGDMDMCIALRTAVVKDDVMYVQAGAGIVADSAPEAEQQECENKALALFNAARLAREIESGN